MRPRFVLVSLLAVAACAQGESGGDVDAKQDLVDAPVTDGAPPTDGPPGIDASGGPDAAIDAPSGTNPDTCAQAQDITAGAMMAQGITVTGDTTGYADDVRPASSCTGYLPDGPDAIYAVTVNAGVTLTATLTATPTDWDVSLELVQPCAATPTCLAGADDNITGPESITYTTTAQGTYYVVVDGYNPGVEGPYSLLVRVQ